jgi:rSAM/selenodomain-associated transferase 1
MNALVIMAKAPIPNDVKTRMIPPLNPETAADLYYNFLLDKINQVKRIKVAKLFIAYTPETSEVFFKKISKGLTLISQVGVDLGERLHNISMLLFNRGFNKVIMLDSDTPNLPTSYIRHALKLLDKFDIVIGPCEDGGYYLIGLRSCIPELFRGISWSTSKVVEQTRKAVPSGMKLSLLNEWYDVDTVEDLLRLKKDLEHEKNKKTDVFFSNTYRYISKLIIE